MEKKMKVLTEEVKQDSMEKWDVEFETKEDAVKWWNDTGAHICSFCEYFIGCQDCPLLVMIDDERFCCNEWTELADMYDKYEDLCGDIDYDVSYYPPPTAKALEYIDLEQWNELCKKIYNKIANLKVGE